MVRKRRSRVFRKRSPPQGTAQITHRCGECRGQKAKSVERLLAGEEGGKGLSMSASLWKMILVCLPSRFSCPSQTVAAFLGSPLIAIGAYPPPAKPQGPIWSGLIPHREAVSRYPLVHWRRSVLVGESGPMIWHANRSLFHILAAPGVGARGEREDEAVPVQHGSWYFLDAVWR
jgi:hypothetical protein